MYYLLDQESLQQDKMSKFPICTLSECKTISVVTVLEHQKVTKDSFSVITFLLEIL